MTDIRDQFRLARARYRKGIAEIEARSGTLTIKDFEAWNGYKAMIRVADEIIGD